MLVQTLRRGSLLSTAPTPVVAVAVCEESPSPSGDSPAASLVRGQQKEFARSISAELRAAARACRVYLDERSMCVRGCVHLCEY